MTHAEKATLFVLCTLLFLTPTAALGSEGYLTQPDLHGDHLIFATEGDLWSLRLPARSPRRLTSHEGVETYPKLSPDGSWLAFSGEYDGNLDVYVLPSEGGEPRRLTWHPDADGVVGWTPDGARVVFRSRREHPHRSLELFTVPLEGGGVEKLPLGFATRIDMEPETGRWAFTRISRETRSWKRYRGGQASDIWVGDPERRDYEQVTTFEGKDSFPMWHGGRIWFLSDEGGTANLWSIRPDGSDRTRHTREDTWDVRWPSMSPDGRIVYVLGADIHLFDPASGRSRKVEIDLPSDRVLTRVRYPAPERWISDWDLSPRADRIALVTRGEIFSVPVDEGVTLRITEGSAARERGARYGPDGERIACISDVRGEEGIQRLDAWGREDTAWILEPKDSGWHFPPAWSPDGRRIAWGDEDFRLWVAKVPGGEPKLVDRSESWEISQYAWSPDGRWLAYVKLDPNDFGTIYLYDTRSGEVHAATGTTTDDHSPAWDPDGRWLWFLGNRSMNPYLGWRDFETVEMKTTRPHALVLREDGEHPFAKRAGLPGTSDEKADEEEKDGSRGDAKPPRVEIDFEGLTDRVVQVPVDRGRLTNLAAAAGRLYWLSHPVKGMAEGPGLFQEPGPEAELVVYDLEEEKAETFARGVDRFLLAADADKLAFTKRRGEIYVVGDASPPGDDLSEARVSLEDIVLELDPRAEWRQIYYEGWRHMRDFHWEEDLGGLDWRAVRDRYATLLPRISTRRELRDLMAELIGELATSHTYVWGGDQAVEVDRVGIGLLGADVERTGSGWRITRIFRADPADEEFHPLLEPGVGVEEGQVILAVNHREWTEDEPFLAAFAGLAGKRVVLTVADDERGRHRRDVVVTTLPGDRDLRYADWVRRNRERVAEASDGRIGYIHVPDMSRDGLIEFDTWFYPQVRKEGMVVDVRWNGGGFVSQLLLERFRRRVTAWSRARGGEVGTYPYKVLNGPFVVLTNQFAGSDGDIFPAAIQLEGLAPVIGMRSWGGVIGIRADKRLVDQGFLTQPEFAWWDPQRGWGLENRGVEPDIVVANPPQALARDEDPQLERGIQEVLRLHRLHPPKRPDFEQEPVKTREAYAKEE